MAKELNSFINSGNYADNQSCHTRTLTNSQLCYSILRETSDAQVQRLLKLTNPSGYGKRCFPTFCAFNSSIIVRRGFKIQVKTGELCRLITCRLRPRLIVNCLCNRIADFPCKSPGLFPPHLFRFTVFICKKFGILKHNK